VAGTVDIVTISGGSTVAFNGNTHLVDLVTTAANNYDIHFFGRTNEIDQAVAFANTGALIFGDEQLDSILFSNGLTNPGLATTTIAGALRSGGTNLSFDTLTVAEGAVATLDTSGGNLVINTLVGTAAGAAESLIIDAGIVGSNGAVTVNNVTGASLGLENLNITDAASIGLGPVTLPGNLTISGTVGSTNFNNVTNVGNATINSTVATNLNSGFTASGNVNITGPLNFVSDLTLAATGVTVTGNVTLGEGRTVSINTGNGGLDVIGAVQGTLGGVAETLNIDTSAVGALAIDNLRGDSTGNGGGTGLDAVVIANSSGVDIDDISLAGTLDVSSVGNVDLVSTDGTTSLQFQGGIGGRLTVNTANRIISVGAVTVGGSSSFTSGFAAPVGTAAVDLANLDATGSVSITADSANVVNAQTLTLGNITIGDPLDVGTPAADAYDASFTATIGTITGSGVVVVVDQFDLDASSGSGGIQLSNANNAFGSLDINSPTGTVNIRESDQTDITSVIADELILTSEGDINATNAANLIDALTITDGGAVTLSNSGPILLRSLNVASLDLTTTGVGSDVSDTLTNTVTVTGLVTINPGGNNITFNKVNLGSLALSNSSAVVVNEVGSIELRNVVAGSFQIDANDDITQLAGTGVTITGLFGLNGNGDVILDGNNNFGSIQIVGNNVELDGSGNIALENITATTLTVTTSGGNITQQGGTVTTVAGQATFETIGGNITLTDTTSSFGSISLTGNAVQFTAAGAIEIEGIDASTLVFTAGGNITGAGLVDVSGSAVFDAGTANLNLTNANNSIAILSVTSSAVDLSLAGGDVELDQINVSGTFDLTAGGAITDASTAVINVGEAILDATGDIVLGDTGSVDLAVLNLSGALIDITVSGGVEIDSVTGDDFLLTAAGAITQSANSDIDVASATFNNAGNDITLTGSDNNLGSIEITSAGNVEITTSGAIELNTINAGEFTLVTGGAVTDGGKIDITGTLDIDAGTADILLNQNIHEFQSLAVAGGEVRIIDGTGDTTLLGITADTFELVSAGNVTGEQEIRVDEELEISADDGVGQIQLTNVGNRLNRLKLTGSSVEVFNTLGTELVDIDVNTLTLTSGGDVTDSADDGIRIGGLATITAAEGFDVIIGNNANDAASIGSLLLVGDRVVVNQTDDVLIEGISATSDLRILSSEGNISAAAGAVISAGGDTVFAVNRNTADITLGGSTNSFGRLSVTGRDIVVTETDDTILTLVDADNFTLNSGGSVSNTDRAIVNTLLLGDLTASGDIVLGDGVADAVNFGRLSLTATNANIIESSGTQFSGLNISGNLTMQSENSMIDEEGASLTVGGLATLTVTGQPQQILFDGVANSFAALNLASDNITINLADNTTLTGVVSDNLVINAPVGIIAVANGSNFIVDQRADLRARRIILNEDANVEVGSLSLSTRGGGAIEIRTDINPRLAAGNPTNAAGSIQIIAPDIFLGVDGKTVSLNTVGGPEGGSISINGVDASGLPDPASGTVHVAGTVSLDTTNAGGAVGAGINVVSNSAGAGTIRLLDGAANGALNLTAGVGSIDMGSIVDEARLGNLTINSALNVTLDDVYISGNTVDITATGDVTISGVLDDAAGDITIQTGGNINIAGSASAAGKLTLGSERGAITTQALLAGKDVFVASDKALLLGSNVTATTGTVTLLSSGSVESLGTITAGNNAGIFATTNITLGGPGVASIVAGNNATISTKLGNVSITDVTAGNDAVVFSFGGRVSQQKDTVLKAGARATISALTGIDIASIQSVGDVTLAINQETIDPNEPPPTFSRVNDPIPLGQGDISQDVKSESGSIVFLAPIADVGSSDPGQNFVLRAGGGIFYGLDQGNFFSDDIGSSNILNSVPSATAGNLNDGFVAATVYDFSDNLSIDVPNITFLDFASFNRSLQTSFSASASAGQTNAASSSRSTAASQEGEEEEVAEVDEVAFQNLKNYDENPQGILLPEDQSFAYDDDGNVYLIVTLGGQLNSAPPEAFTLYKVKLDLDGADDDKASGVHHSPGSDKNLAYGYRPEFLNLHSASGED
jgi:hypothetical protein